MCQEIHLSDVRLALLDYCEEWNDESPRMPVDDLLDRLAKSEEDGLSHASFHRRRARRLAAAGDMSAATIHRALLENMARAAG